MLFKNNNYNKMTILDLKLLKDYIKNYSTLNSRNNAKSIKPKLIKKFFDRYDFEYLGSSSIPYKIEVDLSNINKITSFCTCPYDNGGICKHRIAAVESITQRAITDVSISVTTSQTKPIEIAVKDVSPKNQFKLENHLLDRNEILPTTYYGSRHYFTYKIESVSQKKITVQNSSYLADNQTYEYNSTTQILEFTCTCSKKKELCEHAAGSLDKIIETFGTTIFSPTYIQDQTRIKLQKYGFTLEDDYQSIFKFELTTKGFTTTTKFKNIVRDETDFSEIFDDESKYSLLHLPSLKGEVQAEYGLGIYFEFTKKKLSRAIPFQGKYNKTKSDFASSIVMLGYDNIKESFGFFDEDFQQKTILKTFQINTLTAEFQNLKELNSLKKAIENLQSVLPNWEKTLLYKYDDKNSLVRKNLTPLTIAYLPVKLVFQISESDYFYNLKAKIEIDGKKYNFNSTSIAVTTLFIFFDNLVIPILDAKLAVYIDVFSKKPEINYLKKDTPNFIEKIVAPLSKNFEIESTLFKKSTTPKTDEAFQKQVFLTDNAGEFISFKLAVNYPEKLIDVFSSEMLFATDKLNAKIVYKERNQSLEDNFVEEFKSLHPNFENQENLFYLTPEELFENFWMLHSIDKMKQMGIAVFGANELKSFKFNLNKPTISVNLKSEIDWFDIVIDIAFGNQKVTMKDLQKAFLKKSNYVALGDGTLGILPEEWMKKFAGYFKSGEIKKNGVQISNYQFGIIDELYEEMETKPAFLEELYNKKMRLQNISEIEAVPLPKGIKAKLRDYQHHGLNWLAFLDKNQLGGCLADDMGLGKTLQTIAFLQHLKSQKKNNPPSLIIAPTSLIFNWNAEIEKFCPSLKMLTFTGVNRMESIADFKKYDIIISTYGSLLNDIEYLKDIKFHYVILDESQAIKNPNSKRYKAVRLLNCYNRIALTGTPIENNTFDLYAQLNFLNPGLLGNMTHFKTQFSDAIDKEKDVDMSQLLGKIITPFMLRRTKEQVATELPDKTENIIFCEMGKEQRTVYDTFKNKYRDYLLNKIDENGVAKSQMYILEGLTKLRQICNSTALVPTEEDFGNYSVKLESLMENIKEKTGNHKILVFSQFVKMLQIVKTRLDDEKIQYEYLDGQTTNRQNNVNNFQNNADIRVFLISLKAGGTGLNLTEADYVFIIDPWWNPAVENQAIDRCYRIGQTKNVMAYRMICKDTIEEKIVSLQQKKKKVASSIISIDDEKKSFNINEVKELFS
jgi:SNF2 family DNA or RNA helicase